MSHQHRHPAGTPTGGRYAKRHRPEAITSLEQEQPVNPIAPRPYPFTPRGAVALAPGFAYTDCTDEQVDHSGPSCSAPLEAFSGCTGHRVIGEAICPACMTETERRTVALDAARHNAQRTLIGHFRDWTTRVEAGEQLSATVTLRDGTRFAGPLSTGPDLTVRVDATEQGMGHEVLDVAQSMSVVVRSKGRGPETWDDPTAEWPTEAAEAGAIADQLAGEWAALSEENRLEADASHLEVVAARHESNAERIEAQASAVPSSAAMFADLAESQRSQAVEARRQATIRRTAAKLDGMERDAFITVVRDFDGDPEVLAVAIRATTM